MSAPSTSSPRWPTCSSAELPSRSVNGSPSEKSSGRRAPDMELSHGAPRVFECARSIVMVPWPSKASRCKIDAYAPDAHGNVVPDFWGVGYRGGDVELAPKYYPSIESIPK